MKKKGLSINNLGFTLIELMVVVTIIGVIAVVTIPQFNKQSEKAKVNAAMGDLRAIKGVIDLHIAEEGAIPAAEIDKDDSIDQLGEVLLESGINWSSIIDPWGNGYRYTVHEGYDYTIDSAGPDGNIGGTSIDDIVADQNSNPESGQTGEVDDGTGIKSGL